MYCKHYKHYNRHPTGDRQNTANNLESTSDRLKTQLFAFLRTQQFIILSVCVVINMILTVASFKGGVGKTTSAIHLAGYLARKGDRVLLVDGDPNRSATGWSKRGKLPFSVCDERQAARYAPQFPQIVIDTEARPTDEDIAALADGCDLLILPATPDALSLDALLQTVVSLKNAAGDRYRLLLTIVPPPPNRDGEEARGDLLRADLPVLNTWIRRYAAFQKAALSGCLVDEVKGDRNAGLGWNDYAAVCKELGL